MKNSTLFKNILPVFAIALILVSCKNPVSNEEHHEEPFGIVLYMNGSEIARQQDGTVTGEITVTAGSETDLISIRFLAEDGDEFVPEEDEFSLGWQIQDEQVADIEQHAEDGKWRFHVVGLQEGNTDIKFQLIHGDHPDFTSLGIPVTVNP